VIWQDSAPGWVCFDQALPRHDGQGPAPAPKP